MAGTPGKDQSDWFAEFKKLNPGAGSPSAPAKPKADKDSSKEAGKPSDRRRHHRFEVDECQATLYREGLLTVLASERATGPVPPSTSPKAASAS